MNFTKVKKLTGEVTIPGDKSISHRAVMFGALAKGTTEVTGFLQGADCLSTIDCFRKLGIDIENTPEKILIHGKGLHGLTESSTMLDVGNSGTTTRLISGILAGQSFTTSLNGDASIQKRPMKRIITPLSMMGAQIRSLNDNGCAPLEIKGSALHGIHYDSPVASAQVKSCVLLAGLYADAPTSVTEPVLSRNHSEIMLQTFGAKVNSFPAWMGENTCHADDTLAREITAAKTVSGQGIASTAYTAVIEPDPELTAQKINVPGDISSAAYWIAAALITPNSELLIKNVGINPTRDGILRVAKAMGADITLVNENRNGEPTADLLVRSSSLHGTTVGGELIPTLIDEIPIICIMAAAAEGTTVIKDAAELKVKESDRIAVMTEYLGAMGCDITATDDGMIIHGGKPLHGAVIDPHLDHRIAMSFAIASLIADGTTTINDAEVVTVSYPEFYQDLERLAK